MNLNRFGCGFFIMPAADDHLPPAGTGPNACGGWAWLKPAGAAS